jgi:hypothetical protein
MSDLPVGPRRSPPPGHPRRTLLAGIGILPRPIGSIATTPLSDLLKAMKLPEKRKIFVSYHHHMDQGYYDALAKMCDDCDFLADRSVNRLIGSNDSDYQERRIREEYISGASVTLVLCGAQTYQRKFVDWEIFATLFKEKGLIGIRLPYVAADPVTRKYTVPFRLHHNIQNGYALWRSWQDLTVVTLRGWIEEAVNKDKRLIRNEQDKKTHDG